PQQLSVPAVHATGRHSRLSEVREWICRLLRAALRLARGGKDARLLPRAFVVWRRQVSQAEEPVGTPRERAPCRADAFRRAAFQPRLRISVRKTQACRGRRGCRAVRAA